MDAPAADFKAVEAPAADAPADEIPFENYPECRREILRIPCRLALTGTW